MAWKSLAPTLPSEVTDAAEGLTTGLQAARTALELLRTEVRLATALASNEVSGTLATAESALNAAVRAVEDGVNALLDDGGGYLLLVPLPKKGLVALLQGSEDARTSAPTGALEQTVDTGVRTQPVWLQAFRESALFLGGNAHFLKTVGEALYDPRDDARPRFGADSYWAYAVLVGGASDLASGMSLAAYIDRLFGSRHGSDSLSATRGNTDIVVQGLRVSPSLRGNSASLDWAIPTSRTVDDESWSVVPIEYAVIRSERPEAQTARKVLDLFPTRELAEGLTGQYGARVLKVGRCDGLTHRYLDTSTLTPNQTYYYHVAIKTRLDGADQEVPLGYELLSSAARYRPEVRRTALRRGTPPDWSRTPSIARLIPAVDRLLDRVTEAVRSIGAATTQVTSISQAAADAVTREIDRLGSIVDALALTLRQLESVFATPDAGVYDTLREGQGSSAAFLADLALAFSDYADANIPPFDSGDEYVCGAIVLLVGPSPAAFERAWALLQSLFGSEETADPILDGINSIQTAIEAASNTLTDPAPSVTFNADMSPRAPGEGDASCE